MSYIAAAGAKDRVSSYFDGFDAFGSAGAGMAANAANYITDTQEGAKRDYMATMGEVNTKGQKQLGGAMQNMSNGQFAGDLFALGGQAAIGVSSFGQKNWGWGKNG